MNEDHHSDASGPQRPAGEDPIAALLRVGGRRPTAPKEVADRVRESTHEAWARMLRSRRRRQWFFASAALAASLAVAVMVIRGAAVEEPVPLAPPLGPPATLASAATLEMVRGAVTTLAEDGEAAARLLSAGDVLRVGAVVESTARGRAALRLAGGASLRLAESTRVTFAAPASLVLERGRLYVDSGGDGASAPVDVSTGLGVVRERGTQFEVRSDDESVRVRVREGAVTIQREGASLSAEAGKELTVGADGRIGHGSVSAFGEAWGWILELAPAFEVEGSRLEVFLVWVRRETGREVRFVEPALAARAGAIVLHGSVAGLRPDEALAAVLPTCGLSHRVSDDGAIVIVAAS